MLICGPNSPFTDITTADGSPIQGGCHQNINIKEKVFHAYVTHENPNRCVVTSYEKYILCRQVPDRTTAYYLRLYSFQETHHGKKAVWFSRQAVGQQKLARVVKGIFQKAGFGGKRTNRYLRVFNIDERILIESATGHR